MEPKVAALQTRITVETARQLVLRRARTVPGSCPVCHAEVELVVLENDAVGEPVILPQIQEWFSKKELHFWRNAVGLTEICLRSLFQCLERSDLSGTGRSERDSLDLSRRDEYENE
jgi:hypothetical protein